MKYHFSKLQSEIYLLHYEVIVYLRFILSKGALIKISSNPIVFCALCIITTIVISEIFVRAYDIIKKIGVKYKCL